MADMLRPVSDKLVINDHMLNQAGRKLETAAGDREKVCESFESFMIFVMMKNLEKTATIGKKGYAEQTYMSMIYEKVGDFLAKRGIGVKEMLMKYSSQENIKVFK